MGFAFPLEGVVYPSIKETSMITLVLKEKVGEPRTLKLTVDTITLGRSQENTICIVDKKISRLHAKIERIGATYQIRDLESGNGTRVNGRRIDFHTLAVGDEIRLGESTLTVQGFDEEEEDDETPQEVVEKAPVPLPQKLQVKDKILQVKNLNSEAPGEAPPPAP